MSYTSPFRIAMQECSTASGKFSKARAFSHIPQTLNFREPRRPDAASPACRPGRAGPSSRCPVRASGDCRETHTCVSVYVCALVRLCPSQVSFLTSHLSSSIRIYRCRAASKNTKVLCRIMSKNRLTSNAATPAESCDACRISL